MGHAVRRRRPSRRCRGQRPGTIKETDVGPKVPHQHHPAANTQRELLDQVACIGGFNPLRANTLVDCLDLYSTAGQAEHVVVVVPDDLDLGGVDAKRITEAVDLLREDLDRAS